MSWELMLSIVNFQSLSQTKAGHDLSTCMFHPLLTSVDTQHHIIHIS